MGCSDFHIATRRPGRPRVRKAKHQTWPFQDTASVEVRMKKLGCIALMLTIAMVLSVPAHAWWRGGLWIGVPVFPYSPPPVYVPPAYYSPPYYAPPPPHRPVWVPPHWNGWRWVPGYWA